MSTTTLKKVKDSVNGRWKKSQHDKFMKALEKYGRDWVKVQKMVKTRTLPQVRSHAQKTFLKMSEVDVQALIAPSDYDCSDNQVVKLAPAKRKIEASKVQGQTKSKSSYQKTSQSNNSNQIYDQIDQGSKIQENRKKNDDQDYHTELYGSSSQVEQNREFKQEKQNKGFFMDIFQHNLEYFMNGGNFLTLLNPINV